MSGKVMLMAVLCMTMFKPLCGQSERQPRHEEKPANAKTTKPQSDQRGTKESPIFVYVEQDPQSKADATKAEKDDKRKEFNDRLVAWSAVGAAVFTGVLVIIGWRGVRAANRTLKAIERQADLMSDTAQRQLRAYLCVSESLVKFTGEADERHLEAQLYLHNGGQTPAYDVCGWVHALIREYPLGDALPPAPPELRKAVGIIPPHDKHIIIAKLSVPDFLLPSVENPWSALYVHGEVVYKDAFKEPRYLKYRLIYGGPNGARKTLDSKGVEVGLLSMDTEGNEGN